MEWGRVGRPGMDQYGSQWNRKNLRMWPYLGASLVAQMVKSLPAMWETWVWSLGWKITWRRKWQPTLVILPGEFQGQKSLVGYSSWGCNMTEHDVWYYVVYPFICGTLDLLSSFHILAFINTAMSSDIPVSLLRLLFNLGFLLKWTFSHNSFSSWAFSYLICLILEWYLKTVLTKL